MTRRALSRGSVSSSIRRVFAQRLLVPGSFQRSKNENGIDATPLPRPQRPEFCFPQSPIHPFQKSLAAAGLQCHFGTIPTYPDLEKVFPNGRYFNNIEGWSFDEVQAPLA